MAKATTAPVALGNSQTIVWPPNRTAVILSLTGITAAVIAPLAEAHAHQAVARRRLFQ